MAEQEAKMRANAARNFTRSITSLDKLLDSGAPSNVVLPQISKCWDKVCECWDKLQIAQDNFIEKTDIDVETHKDGFQYLDTPTDTYNDRLLKFTTYCNAAKASAEVSELKTLEDQRIAEEARRKKIKEERNVLN